MEAASELVHEGKRVQPAKGRGKNTPGRRKSMKKCRGVCERTNWFGDIWDFPPGQGVEG